MSAFKNVLIDSPDGAEEFAWVTVSAAATPRDAVELATKEEPPGDPCFYECTGREWHRRDGEPEALGNETWMPCSPDDEGAVEFWAMIVAEPESEGGNG